MAMKRLIVALGFLTRLPVPRVEAGPRDFAAAVRLYPLAGLAVGGLVSGSGWLGGQIDPWIGALAALAAWVWVTGALHLDGLGDLADGLGAAHGDRDRLLGVMADPHIGSFGVIAIVLQLAAKLVLLHLLVVHQWLVILAIPAAARIGPLLWARALKPLKREGLGATIADAVRERDVIGWTAILLGVSVTLPCLLAAPLLILLLAAWFRARVGGVTGDVHGAGIEMIETGLLLVCAVQAAL